MLKLIDDHRPKDWFKKAMENCAVDGKVYVHGINVVKKDMKEFYGKDLHRIQPYDQRYIPNPYRFQYDFFIHLWINYFDILEREIEYLRSNSEFQRAAELEDSGKLYGISRSDCVFGAAEIRWPTHIAEDGARTGKFVRDPWSERRIDDTSDRKIKYLASFGGAGQGKTTTFTAFNLMMFDHYLFTEKGARCMISTTMEDKLKAVAWPYITNLNRASRSGISLYAGKAVPAGDFTLKRPNNKDTAGVFKGLLLGKTLDETSVVDKLTGTHGHWYVGYTLDEAQSTSPAPMTAALNFTLHAKDSRVQLAGNYSEDDDTLGQNTEPQGGWSEVDENTQRWVTKTKTGQDIIVLHFNNDNSPGMSKKGSRIFPYLPSYKHKQEKYPTENLRGVNNSSYRRFWMGWRTTGVNKKLVLTEDLININFAGLPLQLKELKDTWFNFDSAPADLDRNPLLIAQSGIDILTGHLVFGPVKYHDIPKATVSTEYYRQSSAEILKILKWENCNKGIVDFTGRPAHAEHLTDAGIEVERLIYNMAIPDGERRNTITGRIDRKIPIDATIDFKNHPPDVDLYAHMVAELCIDFAAWLLMTYVQCKRVRGINKEVLRGIRNHGIDKEFYSHTWYLKESTRLGDRFKLGVEGQRRKKAFLKSYGFSPDLFDVLLEMAWFAFFKLNIPLTPADGSGKVDTSPKKDFIDSIQEIHDSAFTLDFDINLEQNNDLEISFFDRGQGSPFD